MSSARRGAGVRIGGGAFGGRRLSTVGDVRPTSSRVREALFSIWGAEIASADLLELFAGSGAVGFEAAGRGANSVDLVEANREVARNLERSRQELDARSVRVLRGELPVDLERLARGRTYGLVFADPPYAYTEFESLLAAVEPFVQAAGLVTVEHARQRELPERVGRLAIESQRRYGETVLSFYRGGGPIGGGAAESAER